MSPAPELGRAWRVDLDAPKRRLEETTMTTVPSRPEGGRETRVGTGAPGSPEHPDAALLVHEALLYSTPGEFVESTEPFLRAGLERGERAFVITNQLNMGPLRAALAGVADDVDWEDTAAWFPKPVDRIQALDRYVRDQLDRGAPRVRIIDESMWPEDSIGAVSELKRFESVCNVVLAALPVWMICPYNASLFNHILPDAYRTHPLIRDARVTREASTSYLQPGEFFQVLDAEHELPPAPRDARVLRFETSREARALAGAEASAAGLHADRIQDLELATSEVATNAIRHARQGAELRVWTMPDEVVCQVSDTGDGMTDRMAGYGEPNEPHVGGWGLLLARKLCDSVEVRTTSEGTVIRLGMQLPGSPRPRH
jgi:anti-sigma regulatory factor (Ser/Thr protein kinase)